MQTMNRDFPPTFYKGDFGNLHPAWLNQNQRAAWDDVALVK